LWYIYHIIHLPANFSGGIAAPFTLGRRRRPSFKRRYPLSETGPPALSIAVWEIEREPVFPKARVAQLKAKRKLGGLDTRAMSRNFE